MTSNGSNGIVVSRDLVVHHIGITICVDDRDDRNTELARLLNGDFLLFGIDHKNGIREFSHPLDSTQRLLQFFLFSFKPEHFFLGESVDDLRIVFHLLELSQAFNALPNSRKVREGSAQPAIMHIEHATALGFFLDRFLCLFLRTDEKNVSAGRREAARDRFDVFKHGHRLLQIDDMDAIAGTKDVWLHLWVPRAVSLKFRS